MKFGFTVKLSTIINMLVGGLFFQTNVTIIEEQSKLRKGKMEKVDI